MNGVKVEKFGPFPRVNRPVFIASALLIVGFIVFGSLFGELAGDVFIQLQSFITHRFRWLFIMADSNPKCNVTETRFYLKGRSKT